MKSARHAATVVATAGLLLGSSMADAADKYAVVSAIGDEFTIVTYQPSVGTNLDSNQRQVVALGDDSFDSVAANAAAAAIRRAVPDAVAVIAKSPDKSVYLHDDPTFQTTAPSAEQMEALRRSVADSGARYLLLVSKAKGETRLHFRNEQRGQGKLFGIGYYFDRFTRVTQSATGRSDRGFLSPYAYLAITLIDLQTGTVIRSNESHETTSIGSAVSENATHPWDAVPAEMKVKALNGVIRKAVSEVVPNVVQPT